MSNPTSPWWREPTRGQWISFGAAWAGWVLDAFDFTIFFLAMPQIAKEFGVTATSTSLSITLTLLMRFAGGYVAGAVADRFGRKLPLMISIFWFAACDGAIAFAPTFAWVLVLRTLFGFGMGAEWTAGATLAMENWPARSRGIASGILQGSWAIGYFLAALVYYFVEPVWGWRALFVASALPALLILPIRIWVPESPEFEKTKQQDDPPRFSELLADGVVKKMIWASVVLGAGFSAYYALTAHYSQMAGDELGVDSRGRAVLVILFNVGMLAGSIICGVLAAKRGVVLAVITPAIVMLPLLPLYVGVVGPLELGALLGGMAGAGYCGVTPMLLADLFRARIRARAAGIVYHVGAGIAAFAPLLIARLVEGSGLSFRAAIAYVAGAALLLLAILVSMKPRASAGTIEAVPASH